ncbi:MAG: hypothetical protein M1812_001433 [Candelaria pacifica]|nr:MAG: hypothetical protein M1812_001433 [Candelaria pacifica]
MSSFTFNLTALTAIALLLTSVNAFWRLPCQGRSALARIDPLVNYGTVGDHAHAIHGGNNFGFSTLHDDLLKSQCTSCQVTQDKSAYWTPALYFMDSNGTTELVPEVGGMLAYYLLYGQNVKAFPDGFTMIAGDTNLRNFSWPVPDPPKSEWSGDQVSQLALSQKALGFNCLDYKKTPEPSLYRHFLPDYDYTIANCPDGIRFELMFPSCWNGKDTDSKNHKSHMAYPSTVNDGECPKGFETRLVSLFYETIWDTHSFAGKSGGQFVLGNGDPTGYGYHGDFIEAWDEGFLQQAVDTCTNESGLTSDCPLFTLQSEDDQKKCKVQTPKQLEDDDCAGPRAGLPGQVAVQAGPAPASKGGAVNEQAVPSSAAAKSSSAAASTSAAASSTVVPVLSYSSVLSTAQYDVSSSASVASSASSSSSSSTITASPSLSSSAAGGLTTVSTQLLTKGNEAWEVFVVEEDVTVTAGYAATTTVAHGGGVRRRHHHHAHRHGAAA